MLLLNIAVILTFATCQFVLPSSSSSETVATIHRLKCMEGCSMRFLNTVISSGTHFMEYLCDGFVEMKECVLGCPGGADAMRLVAGMVPQSFKLVTEMCQGEGTTGTLSPDVLSGVLNEAIDRKLNYCVIGCEWYLGWLNLNGPHGRPAFGVICETWATYQECVIGCPKGAEVMTYVQKTMANIFKTIKDECDRESLTGPYKSPYLLNRETKTDYPGIELTTDNTYFDALSVTMDASESMLKCKGKCLIDLDGLRVSSGVTNLCGTWKNMKTCLEECFGDPQMAILMLGDVSRILPRTVDYLKGNCNDDTPSSLDMPYFIWQDLLAEEKEADERKLLLSFYTK